MRLFGRRPWVQQFLPTLGYRDAVGTHTLVSRGVLRSSGIRGGIWVEEAHPPIARQARSYTHYPVSWRGRSGRDVLLYQASTGSHGMADFLCERREPKLLYYHNVTPAEFFEPYDAGGAMTLARGREELKRLAPRVRLAMANSDYSADELRRLGARDVRVVPPFLPPGLDASPNPDHAAWLRRTKEGIDVLFVGRVSPNKGHLHLLRAFGALRAAVEPKARLFVVGQPGPETYMREVFRVRERLGSAGVVFTGSVDASRLVAHYQEADVLCCLSEHEGFGLPLIEAMRAGLPVVAYDGGAVGETLGGAGVLLRTLDPPFVAEVVHRVATDARLREEILRGQAERVAALERVPREELLRDAVRAVLEG